MCTKIGVDSWSCFTFTARTRIYIQTPTHIHHTKSHCHVNALFDKMTLSHKTIIKSVECRNWGIKREIAAALNHSLPCDALLALQSCPSVCLSVCVLRSCTVITYMIDWSIDSLIDEQCSAVSQVPGLIRCNVTFGELHVGLQYLTKTTLTLRSTTSTHINRL